MSNGVCLSPEWVSGHGPESDIVISTRARLARSLAGYPFPHRASPEHLAAVVREVRSASAALSRKFPGLRSVDIRKLDVEQKAYLLDLHLASPDQVNAGEGRAVILEPSAVFSIMVNEEDHLRLQALMSGMVPEDAWDLVDMADDVLSGTLEYGYSPRYGYLTSSVSNVGTGLRISVMMHLAGMSRLGKAAGQLRAAYDLGVSVRGLFGEGTRSIGDLFQVSNEVTLAISEQEIVQRVRSVARYLLDRERSARKELLSARRKNLVDEISKALKILQNSRAISAHDAIAYLSPLRLAVESGLIDNCPRSLLNELLAGMRAGVEDDGAAKIQRADFLRRKLSGVEQAAG